MEEAELEVEAISSIWEDVQVERNSEDAMILRHKIRSMEDVETSASLRIECQIAAGYPNVMPIVTLSNPRGISDGDFEELKIEIKKLIETNDGMPVISSIFQVCSDFLANHQDSTELKCSICLKELCESAIFVTKCDHFLHSDCFVKFVKFAEKEINEQLSEARKNILLNAEQSIFCPVCRFKLTIGDDVKSEAKELIKTVKSTEKKLKTREKRESTTSEDVKIVLNDWRQQQKRLEEIYAKQKENGGIIDEELKKQQFFYIGNPNSS